METTTKRIKLTGKQLAFYKLLKEKNFLGNYYYLPAWKFVGILNVKEMNTRYLLSYKVPARLSDLFNQNPDMLDREKVVGEFGRFYKYKLSKDWKDKIQDKTLIKLLELIK